MSIDNSVELTLEEFLGSIEDVLNGFKHGEYHNEKKSFNSWLDDLLEYLEEHVEYFGGHEP